MKLRSEIRDGIIREQGLGCARTGPPGAGAALRISCHGDVGTPRARTAAGGAVPGGFVLPHVLPLASPCFLQPDRVGAAGTERCLLLPQAPLLCRLLLVQGTAANTDTTQGAFPPLHRRPLRPHGHPGPGFLALRAGDRAGDGAGAGAGAGRWFPAQAARHSLSHRGMGHGFSCVLPGRSLCSTPG